MLYCFLFLSRKEFQQQENLMDDLMEEGRKQALQNIRKKREQDWAQKQKYAISILEQIQEHEEQRLQKMDRLQKVIIIGLCFSSVADLMDE
jgi:hypothetical protein